jgi:polyhydroxyalkanoate synthesis repressor PhaR
MPILIKRYPNRKLYDTDAKQYINLDGISDLLRHGNEVQVIDHATGEDLTALTLTQVITELEKKQTGFLPNSLLAGLVQAGGSTIDAIRRKLVLQLELFHNIDEEIERRINMLIKYGELSIEDGFSIRNKLIAPRWRHDHTTTAEEIIRRYLDERGVPTKLDLQQITAQIEVLADRINELD